MEESGFPSATESVSVGTKVTSADGVDGVEDSSGEGELDPGEGLIRLGGGSGLRRGEGSGLGTGEGVGLGNVLVTS